MSKLRLATVWLDGCSGCHMSMLDMDERWLELADLVDLVYGPFVDSKQYPDNVDVVLVEGAVSSEEDLQRILRVRKQTRILASLGDCAVTANVPSLRNQFPLQQIEDRAYLENADFNQQVPRREVPPLFEKSRPVHEFVKVDLFIPGCPPSADTIYYAVSELIAGRMPDVTEMTRFGA
jgi:NAD-reducing hydrogenase small subunit